MSAGARVRVLVAVVAVAALVAASIGLLTEATPVHGRTLDSIFEDDTLLVDQPISAAGDAKVQDALETMKGLGADTVRVLVIWRGIAPAAEPAHFDAANPASYGTGWEVYDRLDVLAHDDGLQVYFDVTDPAPSWATPAAPASAAGQPAGVYLPSAADFGAFVRAVGERYDGSYKPVPTSGALPRVNFWSVWNEPNQPGWISPQQDAQGADGAPALYRVYLDEAWRSLVATGHTAATDTILFGELAPEGCTPESCQHDPTGYKAIAPLPFLRELYCVSGSYTPLVGAAALAVGCPAKPDPSAFVAAHPALFDATGLSEHPYSFFLAPSVRYSDPDESGFVPISQLNRLDTALDRVYSAYGSTRQLPLYLTEYGYVTNPPDSKYTVTLGEQAQYLNEATYLAYEDPRVRALGQFELQDSLPQPGGWFPEGLEFYGGAKKLSFDAYRLPIWVADTSIQIGAETTVWGMLRPARNNSTESAQIQFRSDGSSTYKTLDVATTNDPSNFFEIRLTLPSSGDVRIAWNSPTGGTFYSRAVAVSVIGS